MIGKTTQTFSVREARKERRDYQCCASLPDGTVCTFKFASDRQYYEHLSAVHPERVTARVPKEWRAPWMKESR